MDRNKINGESVRFVNEVHHTHQMHMLVESSTIYDFIYDASNHLIAWKKHLQLYKYKCIVLAAPQTRWNFSTKHATDNALNHANNSLVENAHKYIHSIYRIAVRFKSTEWMMSDGNGNGIDIFPV